MKRTGSNNNDQNVDLNTADNDIQLSQLAAANYGDSGTAPNESGKISVLNRRTLGVASVLGLLFASLLAGTSFFTSADDSGSSAPNFAAKTVSEKTTFTFSKSQPAEFSTAGSLNRSVLDLADISSSQKTGRSLAASRNQGVAETSAAQSGSVNSVRSQCSGDACLSPRRAPVTTGVTVRLFKLGVANSAFVSPCVNGRRLCSAANGELVAGAKFALYKGSRVDEANKVGEFTVDSKDGVEIPGLQLGEYALKEVEAPAGYEVNPNPAPLEVMTDGKVRVGRGRYFKELVNNEFYFPNAKSVSVKLFKLGVEKLFSSAYCDTGRFCTATDGQLLEGAKFALFEGAELEDNKVGEYTVGKDGLKIPLQAGKTYTLKEVVAPTGYLLNPASHTLLVDKTGNVKYVSGKDLKSLNQNNEFYVPNEKAPEPEVWLFKLGVADLTVCDWGSCSAADGELLDGAEFALYEGSEALEANKVGETFTVGTGGLKIPGLQVGKTYSLVEVKSPAGYEVNAARYTFEVDADGKAKRQTDNGSEFFVDNKIYFPNKKVVPAEVTVRLFKLGVEELYSDKDPLCASRALCAAGDGELVGGAKFALYKGAVSEDNLVGEYIVVGKDGVELPGLQPGSKYILKEIEAPAGYQTYPRDVTFSVDKDGKPLYFLGKHYYNFVNNEFYFPNLKVQTIDISLNKVSDKDIPLENVKFDLYEADNLDKPVQNLTTKDDGKANLTVTLGHKYRLVETQTTPGYALLPQPIDFQVEANGTVTIEQANGNVNTVTGGDKTLKVVNYPEGKLPLSGQSGFLVVLLSGLSLLLVAVVTSFLGRKRN